MGEASSDRLGLALIAAIAPCLAFFAVRQLRLYQLLNREGTQSFTEIRKYLDLKGTAFNLEAGGDKDLPGNRTQKSMLKWSARLELCQWIRETLDEESIWDEARRSSQSRWLICCGSPKSA